MWYWLNVGSVPQLALWVLVVSYFALCAVVGTRIGLRRR